jgi:hypothetical protein
MAGMLLWNSNYAIKAETNLNSAQLKIEQALKDKTFYSFNIALAEIMKLPDSLEKSTLLGRINTLSSAVWTPQVTKAVDLLNKVCNQKDGKIYTETESYLKNLSQSEMDIWTQGYLLGELTGWGRKLVFTPDYVTALDSLGSAWSKKDQASYDIAYANISIVKNQASKDYLLGELVPLKPKITGIDPIQLLKAIQADKSLTREGRVAKLIELAKKDTGLHIPLEVFDTSVIYTLADQLPFLNISNEVKLTDLQKYIDSFIAMQEAAKLIHWSGNQDRTIQSNSSGSDINISELMLSTSSSLLKDTKVEFVSDGFTDRFSNMSKPNECTYVKDGQVYLKNGKATSNGNWDCINIKVSYKTSYTETSLIFLVK